MGVSIWVVALYVCIGSTTGLQLTPTFLPMPVNINGVDSGAWAALYAPKNPQVILLFSQNSVAHSFPEPPLPALLYSIILVLGSNDAGLFNLSILI